ncbi:hypothetical protein CEXT_76181 [Caerostris extrusa]|uniref:Uncharacterized protein n=1 Tax=Caerostris extrusa TaxID=172846 RepID=A0AAV4P5N4_CAEEX|nr:hypothetical protein CEXT_76181 [Caerostris extrusa]
MIKPKRKRKNPSSSCPLKVEHQRLGCFYFSMGGAFHLLSNITSQLLASLFVDAGRHVTLWRQMTHAGGSKLCKKTLECPRNFSHLNRIKQQRN